MIFQALTNLTGCPVLTTFDPFCNGQEPTILLRDEFYCGILVGRRGKRLLLFGNALDEARKKAQKRPPEPPKIQSILKRAYELKMRLDSSPGLTRDALAKHMGIDPSYLTRILNLLNLHPEIQKHILAMPLEIKRGPLTERRLIPIARTRDRQVQMEAFHRLLAMPARAKKMASPILT